MDTQPRPQRSQGADIEASVEIVVFRTGTQVPAWLQCHRCSKFTSRLASLSKRIAQSLQFESLEQRQIHPCLVGNAGHTHFEAIYDIAKRCLGFNGVYRL